MLSAFFIQNFLKYENFYFFEIVQIKIYSSIKFLSFMSFSCRDNFPVNSWLYGPISRSWIMDMNLSLSSEELWSLAVALAAS